MRSLCFAIVLFVIGFSAQAAAAQCCCSGADIKVTDGGGVALPVKDVKITVLSPAEGARGSVRASTREKDDPRTNFHVGCGNGKEALLIEYMGVQMRVRFKLYGDFGHPPVDIAFAVGDFVAEFEKEREDDGKRKVVTRPATAEEMKEIEPVAEPDAAAVDQTANTF